MIQINDELKASVRQCATLTTDLSLSLATAGTLCVYTGADTIDIGLNLFVASVCVTKLSTAYTDLISTGTADDMYDLTLFETILLPLPKVEIEFEAAFLDFNKHLLYLCGSLQNMHLSSIRLQAIEGANVAAVKNDEEVIHKDAELFSVLHQQSLWRNLALSIRLHTDILFRSPRLNTLWYTLKQRLSAQDQFVAQDISKTLISVWQERARDIELYHLSAFDISGPDQVLKQLQQRTSLDYPTLLFARDWHQTTQTVELQLHQWLEHFYTPVGPKS